MKRGSIKVTINITEMQLQYTLEISIIQYNNPSTITTNSRSFKCLYIYEILFFQ